MKTISLCIVFFSISTCLGQSFRIVPGATQQESSDSVRVTFKVLARDGHAFGSLRADQVFVQENDVPIHSFSFGYQELPAQSKTYIVLVLDASGSMRYDGKLARLREAAGRVVRAMTDEEYCSIITFSSRPQLVSGFTDDKAFLEERIQAINAQGYTAIYDAVWEAIGQLESQSAASPKLVLLVSDGEEEGASLFKLDNIIPKLQSISNLTIHTFDLNRKKAVNDLQRLASLGHGSYTHHPDAGKVFIAFGQFLDENRKTYTLSYLPPRSEGSDRRVSVGVSLRGINLRFEGSYHVRPSGSLWKGSSVAVLTGMVILLGMSVAGAMAYVKRVRSNGQAVRVRIKDPLLVEAPRMAFDVFGSVPGEEKTRALTFEEQRDDEKTVIIEERKKTPIVFGYLTVTDVNAQTSDLEIDSPEVLFGRSTQCKAKFENMEVSRLHAKLRLEGEGFVLYDLGSANGTFVNGEEIQKRLLRSGDVIEVGNNRIVFRGTNGHDAVAHQERSV